MLVTTYQHDFIPPFSKRYEFLKGHGDGETKKGTDECQCIEKMDVEVPKKAEKQCAVEWSGIAPMGRLIDPRIIPTKFAKDQVDRMANDGQTDCFKEQPNRFLMILRTAYPDLYDRLKQMPKDELNRRLEQQRMYTTYQIDYCNINEYPEGVYESLKEEDETSKLNASKLLQAKGPCAEFRTNVMKELDNVEAGGGSTNPCEKAHKPFKVSFADSSRFISSGDNSHWGGSSGKKKPNFTEYMDSISRTGCVIMKNNIHDHRKCNGAHCRHQLVHACKN